MGARWDKDRCKKIFIESNIELTISDIAKLAERDRTQVNRWCTGDEEGNWRDLRKVFQSKLARATQQEVIENRSQKLALDLRNAQERHVIGYRTYERIARISGGTILDEVEELNRLRNIAIQLDDKDGMIALGRDIRSVADPTKIKCYVDILDKAIRGEQKALGMDYYINPNAAFALLESMGNEIVEKEYYQDLVAAYEQSQERDITINAIEEFK